MKSIMECRQQGATLLKRTTTERERKKEMEENDKEGKQMELTWYAN